MGFVSVGPSLDALQAKGPLSNWKPLQARLRKTRSGKPAWRKGTILVAVDETACKTVPLDALLV